MSHANSEGNFAPCTSTAPAVVCPTPEAASASMQAKEMNQLSVEERETVLEDIHGIARGVDEPFDYVKNSLVLLEEELSKPTQLNKGAYDLAKFQSKEYVSSEKLRMMFLRAESFDAFKAASRMVKFFYEKYNIFGAEKLTKDIVLADLDPDDIAALEKGFYQVLAEKDSAGRKVCCYFPKLKVVPRTQNVLRALYYTLMRCVEDDEEAQQRGVVACMYLVDHHPASNINPDMVRKTGSLRNALPVRVISAHLCYNDPQRMLPFLSLGVVIMGTHTRVRCRAHYGSDEECRCQLSSFGIPTSTLPVSCRGEFNLENQRTFMAMQRGIDAKQSKGKVPLCVPQKTKQKPEEKARSRQLVIKDDVFLSAPQPNLHERTGYGFLPLPNIANPWWSVVGASNVPSVVLPAVSQSHITGPATSASLPAAKCHKSPAKPHVIYDLLPNDVLLGRGKPIQKHPGNVRFRQMLDSIIEKYGKGEKGAKVRAVAYIIDLVKVEGGRFLKELEDGGWVEIDEATARAKVSHTFRTRRQVFQANLKKDRSTA